MNSTNTPSDNLVERFDEDDDLEDVFDFNNPSFPNREVKRVNVDFPLWMVEALDGEAARIGVNRQAVIKTWIAERFDRGVAAVL